MVKRNTKASEAALLKSCNNITKRKLRKNGRPPKKVRYLKRLTTNASSTLRFAQKNKDGVLSKPAFDFGLF